MQLPLSWEPSPRPAAARRTGFAMRSAAVLALLLYTGQAIALPVNSLMNKGDAEVMKCIVEVISDTLSKPSPMPVSQECFETLRGDERILSILRHQNLLKELQELAFQGAKERAWQQKQPSSFEEELSEVLENQREKAELKEATGEASSQDAVEKRGESVDKEELGAATEEAGPRVSPPPRLGSETENDQAPREEEAANTHHPASLPGQEHPSPQVQGDTESPSREKGQGGGQGQQSVSEEEVDEEAKAGERGVSQEEDPTSTLNPLPSLSYKETRRAPGRPETLAVEGREKTGAEPSKGKGRQESSSEEEMVGPPKHPVRGGKSGELEQQGNSLSKEWEDAKRWSKMDQLAKQLTAKKRLVGEDMEDDPDRSMKLAFRARSYDFGGPGPQLRRGWRPSSQEDSVEAGLSLPGHGYPEEKKEEEGSANRRAEDQELESLSAIEAELEKVAHQLQALRQG